MRPSQDWTHMRGQQRKAMHQQQQQHQQQQTSQPQPTATPGPRPLSNTAAPRPIPRPDSGPGSPQEIASRTGTRARVNANRSAAQSQQPRPAPAGGARRHMSTDSHRKHEDVYSEEHTVASRDGSRNKDVAAGRNQTGASSAASAASAAPGHRAVAAAQPPPEPELSVEPTSGAWTAPAQRPDGPAVEHVKRGGGAAQGPASTRVSAAKQAEFAAAERMEGRGGDEGRGVARTGPDTLRKQQEGTARVDHGDRKTSHH
jgi:hypothetical protein